MAKKLSQEQYQVLLARGMTPETIETVAKQKGYSMPDGKGFLEKASGVVSSIFPGQKIGEAIGTLGGLGVTKAKEMVGAVPEGTTAQYDTSAPSPLQVGADIGQAGLNVALFKGAGTAGSFGQRVLKMAGFGAGISGASAMKEGASAGEVAKSTLAGGAVGAAIPVAGAGLRAVGNQISQLPSRFVNSALGRSKQQILADISKDKVDDFAKYVVMNKPIATANKLLSSSRTNVEALSNKIGATLASSIRQSGSKVSIGRNNILDDVVKLPEATGALLKRNDVQGIIERLAPQTKQLLQKKSLTLIEANKLRQLLDKTLGDRAFLGGQLSSDKAILKGFANTLREQVKAKAPEGTRALFTELANEIRLRDVLLNKVAKQGNQILSFGDILGGSIGGAIGGIPGAATGVAVRRGLESVPVKLTAAKLTNALTKLEPVIQQMTPAQQTAILNFFGSVFSPDSPE
jgi:hypothetical protein